MRHIHPFPARMAPEIAISAVKNLKAKEVILDPMTGSGTVLHQAALNGLVPIGFDLDPLAILMSKISTNRINTKKVSTLCDLIIKEAKILKLKDLELPWIDNDKETIQFIDYWFAPLQKRQLRKISFLLNSLKLKNKRSLEIDVLRIALSRIIITKKVGASLAWDISHSRPHKMRSTNDYNVFEGFSKSVASTIKFLDKQGTIENKSSIQLGDARDLSKVKNNTIDRVITSPPYLNAIDYMRGHKFSLVWLGYSIPQLRKIRSTAIGVEKKISAITDLEHINKIYKSILPSNALAENQRGMIKRYINDSVLLMSEISRVLKRGKEATLVVGNSNLNGTYIKNSHVFKKAGQLVGLSLVQTKKREIPLNKRYLPVPTNSRAPLGKRMRHEVIMTFINKK